VYVLRLSLQGLPSVSLRLNGSYNFLMGYGISGLIYPPARKVEGRTPMKPTETKFIHAAPILAPTLPDSEIHSSLIVAIFMRNDLPVCVGKTWRREG
jgi:hypothetical protein